jgi:hypothetical protein
MTENTAIERLDYSKPPPGYTVQVDGAKAHTPGAWVWTTTIAAIAEDAAA